MDVYAYQVEKPNRDRIETLLEELDIPPSELVGKRTSAYREHFKPREDGMDRDEWIDRIVQHPEVLKRPIIRWDKKARIMRPPEEVLDEVLKDRSG